MQDDALRTAAKAVVQWWYGPNGGCHTDGSVAALEAALNAPSMDRARVFKAIYEAFEGRDLFTDKCQRATNAILALQNGTANIGGDDGQ